MRPSWAVAGVGWMLAAVEQRATITRTRRVRVMASPWRSGERHVAAVEFEHRPACGVERILDLGFAPIRAEPETSSDSKNRV